MIKDLESKVAKLEKEVEKLKLMKMDRKSSEELYDALEKRVLRALRRALPHMEIDL